MQTLTLLWLLACAGPASEPAEPVMFDLSGIVLDDGGDPPPPPPPWVAPTIRYIGADFVGDDCLMTVSQLGVEVVVDRRERRPVVVEVQAESSVAVGDDGPHLDLLDWKHAVSGWVPLPQTGPNRFQLDALPDPPSIAYMREELVEAIRASGGFGDAQRWVDVAEREPSSAYTGVSRLRFRAIAVPPGGPREGLATAEVCVAMGC